jgi:LEA14-like dessication related protein
MLPRAPLLFAFSLLLLSACSLFAPKFEKPEVSVVGVRLVGGNLLQQNFRVTLKVHNPNDRVIPVSRLTADLRVAGEEIASGQSSEAFSVPAQGDAQFDVLITANLAVVLTQLAKHRDMPNDAIVYDVTGVASLDLPFMRSLPFHQSGSFSLNGG